MLRVGDRVRVWKQWKLLEGGQVSEGQRDATVTEVAGTLFSLDHDGGGMSGGSVTYDKRHFEVISPAPAPSPAVDVKPGRFPPQAGDVWAQAVNGFGGIIGKEHVFTGQRSKLDSDCWATERAGGWRDCRFTDGSLTFVRYGTAPEAPPVKPPEPAKRVEVPVKRDPYEEHTVDMVVRGIELPARGLAARTFAPPRTPWVSDLDPDFWIPNVGERGTR